MKHRIALALGMIAVVAVGCDEDGSADAGATDAGGVADGGPGIDAAPADAAVDGGPVDAAPDAGPPTDPLDGAGAAALVQDGFAFLEGPVWRATEGDLLFTDIPGDTIHRLVPPSTIDVFRTPSGNANGLALLPDGRLLAAEHGNRRVSATASDGTVTALAEAFDGSLLNSPNDLAVRSDGTVYFTDPPYGLAGRTRKLDFHGVFRVDPTGTVHVEHRATLAQRPNGIALSPDETRLYVADTADDDVVVFDVAIDGTLSGRRALASGTPNADGMAVDVEGNLYVATADGVAVIAPDGTRWGTLAVPQAPANCAFGGADRRTLYVTARTGLYALTLPIAGL